MLFSCAVGLSMIRPTRPGVGYSDHHLLPDFLSAAHARNTAIKRMNNDARITHISFSLQDFYPSKMHASSSWDSVIRRLQFVQR